MKRYDYFCSSLSVLLMLLDLSYDINTKISRKIGLSRRNKSYGRLKMDLSKLKKRLNDRLQE